MNGQTWFAKSESIKIFWLVQGMIRKLNSFSQINWSTIVLLQKQKKNRREKMHLRIRIKKWRTGTWTHISTCFHFHETKQKKLLHFTEMVYKPENLNNPQATTRYEYIKCSKNTFLMWCTSRSTVEGCIPVVFIHKIIVSALMVAHCPFFCGFETKNIRIVSIPRYMKVNLKFSKPFKAKEKSEICLRRGLIKNLMQFYAAFRFFHIFNIWIKLRINDWWYLSIIEIPSKVVFV